jgi:hypothetical protein
VHARTRRSMSARRRESNKTERMRRCPVNLARLSLSVFRRLPACSTAKRTVLGQVAACVAGVTGGRRRVDRNNQALVLDPATSSHSPRDLVHGPRSKICPFLQRWVAFWPVGWRRYVHAYASCNTNRASSGRRCLDLAGARHWWSRHRRRTSPCAALPDCQPQARVTRTVQNQRSTSFFFFFFF